MSITTKRGDGGQTGLAGGIRISKADLRVESYGSIDELNTVLGLARSICQSEEIAEGWTEGDPTDAFPSGVRARHSTPESNENNLQSSPPKTLICLPTSFTRSRQPKGSCPIGLCRERTLNPQRTRSPARSVGELNAQQSDSSKMEALCNLQFFLI